MFDVFISQGRVLVFHHLSVAIILSLINDQKKKIHVKFKEKIWKSEDGFDGYKEITEGS